MKRSTRQKSKIWHKSRCTLVALLATPVALHVLLLRSILLLPQVL